MVVFTWLVKLFHRGERHRGKPHKKPSSMPVKRCGRPHGRPRKRGAKTGAKDYHKKDRITFRLPRSLISDFKEECRLHGVAGSDIVELLLRNLLFKKQMTKLKQKLRVDTETA